MTETARHYELIEDDPGFGMSAGDVLACLTADYDRDKLIVVARVSDGMDPRCSVYKSQVRPVAGESPVRLRDADPWGFELVHGPA